MSAIVGKNKIEESDASLYDPYPGFTINSLYTEIPWPEWNDADVNAETWAEPKVGKETAINAPKNGAPQPLSDAVFEDDQPPELPPAISDYVHTWKRAQKVFENACLTVYEPSNEDFKLRVPSCLSPDCEFFKAFMEELPILQFYALNNKFPVELETQNFVANTQGDSWRPWHHIYALCKAGKGQVHKPQYCPYGKYILRLFYMGAWRKFIVDDKIPCDVDGNCMLPVTQIEGELWPIILIKGLLKILSLTSTDSLNATDFPFLCTLTGWAHASFNAVNKSSDQVWRRFFSLVPNYEPPGSQSDKDREVESKATSIKNLNSDKGEVLNQRFCFLFGILKEVPFNEMLNQNCMVAVIMTRDCPLVKANKREGTKPWKRIRWIYWAKEKGLWIDEDKLPPYRHIQIISFFQELKSILTADPRLEAALYDTPIDEDSEPEELLCPGEENYKPEQWCDYHKFFNYLSRVQVFFKPSIFDYNFTVTCLKEKSVDIQPTGKSTTKPVVSQNLFSFYPVLKLTCNEPIFLFSESLTGIFLFISFWVSPKETKNSLGYLEEEQPKILKVGHASLVVEEFDWRSFEQGKIITLSKTVGYSAVGLGLKPGRHILRLWFCSDSPYVINIYSNNNIVIQKSPKIRFLMLNESQRILEYINDVSNAFIALTQKFGKPELPEALREFYDIIKPGHDGMIGYRKKLDDFIDNFLICILLSLKELTPVADETRIMMWALQSLFFNPNIYCKLPPGAPFASLFGGNSSKKQLNKPVGDVKERTLSEIMNYVWLPEEIDKIVTIQRFFRGYRVRLLWKYQTTARREFKPYTERLKKICDTIFIPPKREQEVGKILRRIIINQPELLYTYRFYDDFSKVIQLDEFSGKVSNVEPFAWVPIARFIIACHSEGLVPCAFYLSCNLEQFVIQGFNNDTNEEIFRMTNAVSPHYYYSNVKGYTIFIFGWNESNYKTVNWKLEMMKMKHFEVIHLCNMLSSSTCQPYSMPTLEVFDVKNIYVPNSKSRICRCLIKIQKQTLLTFRFSTSYTDVKFLLIILLGKQYSNSVSEADAADRVITRVTSSNGCVLLSSVVLEHIENDWWDETYSDPNSTVYIIEAYVLDNSWPLTKKEWGLVEPIRVNGIASKDSRTNLNLKKLASESRRKLVRSSRRSFSEHKIVDSPSWVLQVLNDSSGIESGEQVVVEEDKSYAESVKAMKASWEEKDPGRRQRGADIRIAFLYMIFEEKKNRLSVEEDYDGGNNESIKEEDIDPQTMIHRLSSFSYLLNDPSPVRYTYSPRILPDTPLCDLIYKYAKHRESIISKKHSLSTNTLSNDTDISSKATRNTFGEMEEERKDFLGECAHYREIVANHVVEEAKLSNQLMEEAYEGRLRAIDRMVRMAN